MNADLIAWLEPLQADVPLSMQAVLERLIVALLLGTVVAQIYRRTAQHAATGASFPVTLILLAVLIAMVTQVIGSNIARAFSLVGALSVVRFRTVVRDTRDTAYVIFAVVVGMAVGSANVVVAVLGTALIGVTSWGIERFGLFGVANDQLIVRVRSAAPDSDPVQLTRSVFDQLTQHHELVGVVNVKQGVGVDYQFAVMPRPGVDMLALVSALNAVAGVQDVRCEHREVY